MIFNFVAENHLSGLRIYSETWAPELAGRVKVFSYDDLPRLTEASPGTYIFSDLEFISPAQREALTLVCSQLAHADGAVRVLNHPVGSILRFELLRRLYAAGKNKFQVFRAAEARGHCRFPVFLRHKIEHWANLSDI